MPGDSPVPCRLHERERERAGIEGSKDRRGKRTGQARGSRERVLHNRRPPHSLSSLALPGCALLPTCASSCTFLLSPVSLFPVAASLENLPACLSRCCCCCCCCCCCAWDFISILFLYASLLPCSSCKAAQPELISLAGESGRVFLYLSLNQRLQPSALPQLLSLKVRRS